MNYKDFAFIVHFNHVMTFGTLTPLVQSRGAVLELMKDRLQRAAGACALQSRPSHTGRAIGTACRPMP